MGQVYTYSPEEVSVVVGGIRLSGFADGTFVTVSRDEQAFNKVTGADGKTSRSKTANRTGTITIVLQQTSPSNDVLSALALADELSNAGVVPTLIKDGSGRTLHAAPTSWVQQVPDHSMSKDIENVEWVMDCAAIDSFIGGNSEQRG
jgi:hypothetical protein